MNKISIEKVFLEAVQRWRAVMLYNVLYSVLYYGLSIILSYAVFRYIGIWDKLMELYPILEKNPQVYANRLQSLLQMEEYATLPLLLLVITGVVFPLNVGMLNVLQKKSKSEPIEFNDLLDGYNGANFFKYATYYILWVMIYNSFAILSYMGWGLMFLWVIFTLMVVPIMYFRKEPLGLAIISSFQGVRSNFLLILVCTIIATIFSRLGLLMMLLGGIFTAPFWLAMIYTLYLKLFPNNIKNQE